MKKVVLGFYLFILAFSAGMVLCIGILSAPVIFGMDLTLPELGVTKYDMGVVMTQIFLRLSSYLNVLIFIIFVCEIFGVFCVRNLHTYFCVFLGVLMIALIVAFNFYYTPSILSAQLKGPLETVTQEFQSLHNQSEWVFKILFLALVLSFIAHFIKLFRKNHPYEY